ncbi:MAG: hypothetical protein JOZ77_03525 [Candidatus Eremiobacteraeota bacterium]|nr:hypothetical protein [Candidatus Eremiobacteraeota bacterium]
MRGTDKRYNPDPIVWVNDFLFVAYQNATGPTGTGGDSTIVQYNRKGSAIQAIKVPGRCDGMRWNPYTNIMWITVNEDANSSLFTWDPTSGSIVHYSFSSAKHGGGYDDLAFSNGMAFIAASNPKLSKKGINKHPAMVSVVLKGSVAVVTPVLMGDAQATDVPTKQTVKLNLTDPDSMTVAPNGDVLLVSQADSEIVWVHSAGSKSQSVSRLLVGTQIDDTVYATQSQGFLYVADAKRDVIYTVSGRFQSNGLYTEAPDDSGVRGFVGKVDTSYGSITPIITGFGSPTGLLFVPTR